MHSLSLKRLCGLMLPTVFLTLSLAFNGARADSPENFGHHFGLFVNERNGNVGVTRARGIQTLESFFAGVPLKLSYGGKPSVMTQREFLLWFEKLRDDRSRQKILSDDVLYPIVWREARNQNWLPAGGDLTYGVVQEFLYRYSVSKKHADRPYHEGLVLGLDEITPDRYTSIKTVRQIESRLDLDLASLKRLINPSDSQRQLILALNTHRQAFENVRTELVEREKPINKIPNLPYDIREKIIRHNLNQILDQISYDYSKNTSNRIHNMITGASQISGKVFLPGETVNFLEELGKGGWNKYKYGWVIAGGTEVWEYGGGLCGSSTITFTPSWRAGLEVVTRYPHSTYYKNLYPQESFGLDSAIYRGSKNLVLRNNTGSPILYYLQNDADKKTATMYVIGNSPYAGVEIEGPIQTARNTYKWIRRIQKFDGTVVEEEIVSKYNSIR